MSEQQYLKMSVKDFNKLIHKMTDILQDINKALRAQNIIIAEMGLAVAKLAKEQKNAPNFDA